MLFNIVAGTVAFIWAAGAFYFFCQTFAALYQSRRPGSGADSLVEILVLSFLVGTTWFVAIPIIRRGG